MTRERERPEPLYLKVNLRVGQSPKNRQAQVARSL